MYIYINFFTAQRSGSERPPVLGRDQHERCATKAEFLFDHAARLSQIHSAGMFKPTKLCMQRWRWFHPAALTVIAIVVFSRRNCGGCTFGRACSAKSRPEWTHRQPCCCRPFSWCTRPRPSSTRTLFCPHSGRSNA